MKARYYLWKVETGSEASGRAKGNDVGPESNVNVTGTTRPGPGGLRMTPFGITLRALVFGPRLWFGRRSKTSG